MKQKIGLALSGGGVKGSYQIGAYYAFRKCHIIFQGITGTSIGAFNGAMIAAKKHNELLEFWRNAQIGDFLSIDEKIVKKINTKDIDFEFFTLSLENLGKIFKNNGISVDNMLKTLDNYALEKLIRNNNIDFGIETVRVKDFKPLELFIDDMKEGSLNNYIMSSCYLPIFKRKKLEDDSYYMDGGYYNYLPVNGLLKKGYDKVYAIDLKAIGIKQKAIDESKIVVIKPSRKLSKMLTIDKESINNNIYLGYYDTLKLLKDYDGYKFIFKNKSNNYYNYLVNKVDKNTTNMTKLLLNASNNKELVIKSIEFLMNKEKRTYYKVYNIRKMVKYYKKHNINSIVNDFVNKL